MIRFLLLSGMLVGFLFQTAAQFKIKNLQVEYQTAPLGMDETHPRFSWQMESTGSARNEQQSAYRILVKNSQNQTVWDSKTVSSDLSLGIAYEGNAIQAREKYTWTLQVWNAKKISASAVSSFETGLLNPQANAWHGAEWIGEKDLPLYSHYLSMYKIEYGVQLDQASKSTQASFIFGANDPRVQNRNLNIMDVQAAKNNSYIRLEVDISPVALSDSGSAQFHVYRVGYDKKDDALKPMASFKISNKLINASNQYQKHTIFAQCNFGVFDFYIDQVDPAHKINVAPGAAPAAGGRGANSGLNLNPVGRGNNYISFPMLSEIGFQANPNQKAQFSDVIIRNFRYPSNPLFSANENPALFAQANVAWDGNQFTVSGAQNGAFVTANPSRFAAPMLRTEFATSGKTIKNARIYATARGIYELYLNGERVGKDYFNPGLTQYNKTHQYQTFDVTSLVKSGQNAWGAWLSEGWWSGNITFTGDNWNYFGDRQS
ncbi:MAG: hypothetical protein RIS68_1117, partial [Bacteroidota bacterium]